MPAPVLSNPPISADTLAKVNAHRAKRSAQMLTADAWAAVVAGHAGGGKTRSLRNTGTSALQTMSGTEKASIGTGLAITAGVAIAGLATGGLAIPVLIGLGAASWAITKAISEIGADYNRANRNWLQRFPSSESAKVADHAKFLTCEAGDALRRAVDHYRMMTNDIIPKEVKPQDEGQYITCADAINHVKAIARFIHHGDKVRNYTLPVLDMLIFYMDQNIKLAQAWADYAPKYEARVQEWFVTWHRLTKCSADPDHVCYAPNGPVGTTPFKSHPAGSRTGYFTAPLSAAQAIDAAAPIEAEELLAAMREARDKIVSGLHQSASKTWNYSAERPATARVAATASASDHMRKKRLDSMIDAVWKEVDRPGYLARAGRRVGHWYTRHNKTEKLGAVMSETIGVGSLFFPMIKGAGALSDLGKTIVSASTSATAALTDKVGASVIKGLGAKQIKLSAVDQAKVDSAVAEDVRGAGLTISKLMPKLMLHFSRAAQAIEKVNTTARITSCEEAFAAAVNANEVVYEMAKVQRYMVPCVAIVDLLGRACVTWAEQEDDLWRDMEAYVGEWIRDEDTHHACRTLETKCYGAKHHKSGGSFLGTGAKWHHISNDPHNPL